jgi:hypothetical protein
MRRRLAFAAAKGLAVGVVTVGAMVAAAWLYLGYESQAMCARLYPHQCASAGFEGLDAVVFAAILFVTVAVVMGPLLARALRLPLPGLYALPVVAACAVSLRAIDDWVWLSVPVLAYIVIAVVVTMAHSPGQSAPWSRV